MATSVVIDKKTIRETTNRISIQQEVLEDKVIEVFLAEIGMEAGKMDEIKARSMSKKAINSYSPRELKQRFDCDYNKITRTDLNNICLYYLVEFCNFSWFSAFSTVADDQLWYAFFPQTMHTCPIISELPSIVGNKNDIMQAEATRRKQLSQLLLLGDLFNELFSNPDNCFVDPNCTKNLPANHIDMFGDARQYIHKALDKIRGSSSSAQEWIPQKTTEYDFDWIKNQLDLGFFDPNLVKLNQSAFNGIYSGRRQLFQLWQPLS